jgi:hypothetical protein
MGASLLMGAANPSLMVFTLNLLWCSTEPIQRENGW